MRTRQNRRREKMSVKSVQAIINGQTVTLNYNSGTGKYEGTVTAPAKSSYNQPGHYYPVIIKAIDNAGNMQTKSPTDETLGKKLQLVVKERTAPVITITYPTASAYITNNKPVITWKVADDDSGVNPDTIGIVIDSGTKITGDAIKKKAVTGGYECSYTPDVTLTDGSHTVKMDASDYDGNAAEQKNVSFKVDTVAPTLTIVSPTDELVTNENQCTVRGETNDATSSPVEVTVKLNSGAAVPVPVNPDGAFSSDVTLKEGLNMITIVAKDGAGKTTEVTRNVTLDTVAPVIHSATITPNPVDAGATYVISVEVTD